MEKKERDELFLLSWMCVHSSICEGVSMSLPSDFLSFIWSVKYLF